jgi:predicted glycosyltransferase
MPRRILLYSHDTVGLGHIRRISRLARHLAEREQDSTVLILTGSAVADSFRLPSNVDIVKLPSLRKLENSRYVPRRLDMDHERFEALRRDLIQGVVENFDPDVFVVDKVPLGVHGELRPTLEHLCERRNPCRIVLSLRDILDSPEEVAESWGREGLWDALRRWYDDVFVWGMREVYDVVAEYDVPDDVAAKFSYCGYIAPSKNGHGHSRLADKKLVVATVGGGGDGAFLLSHFLRSLRHARERFASVVLTGPELSPERRASLTRLVPSTGRPVFLIDFSARAERLLAAATVVVSMGGYNTLAEVVSRGRRAIVVPRTEPRREQLIRAERFQELGLLRMIRPEQLSPPLLGETLDEELRATREPPGPTLDFGGLDRGVELLAPASALGGTQ